MNWAEELIIKNKARPVEKRRIIAYLTYGGQAVYKPLEELPSFLIGGWPGQGKSSAMVFYACQIVMAGGELVIIDPHSSAPRDSLAKAVAPLAQWFALPPLDFTAVDSSVVVNYFQFVLDEYKARKLQDGTVGKKPLYVMVDEWNELLDELDKDELEEVLLVVRTVARGGRKYGMHVALAAQQWQLAATGGSPIRKSTQGRIAFNCEQSDIKLVLQTRDTRKVQDLCTPALSKGDAIMKMPTAGMGMERVRFLYAEKKACEETARLMRKHTDECEYSIKALPLLYSADGNLPLDDGTSSAFMHSNEHSNSDQASSQRNTLHPESQISHSPEKTHSTRRLKSGKVKVNMNVNEKEAAIRTAAFTQLRLTGKINRTKLRDDLGMNNHDWSLIMRICDEIPLPQEGFTAEEWQALKAHYDYTCLKCQKREPEITLTRDHIIPQVKGGLDKIDNIQPLCVSCNSSKRERIIDYRQERIIP